MNQCRKIGMKMVSLLLAMAMLFTMQGVSVRAEAGDAGERKMPANPVHHCTGKDDGTDTTDWSYVYFGSYPQTEVTGDALTAAIIGADYDENGDAWVNGTKYRRINKSNINNTKYFGNIKYRYFKWERIRWRVLKVGKETLFIVADKGLDCKNYHDIEGSITWEDCTLRSWLNSFFYDTAFNGAEQGAIISQNVVNENNPYYGTEGGNDTKDKVFLLSIEEVTNFDNGFCENYSNRSVSRRIQVTDYAHISGAYMDTGRDYKDNCWWWLRSPGANPDDPASVNYHGYVHRSGIDVDGDDIACVPALHIDFSSDLWSLADDGSSGEGGGSGTGGSETPDIQVSSFQLESAAMGMLGDQNTISGKLELSETATSERLQQQIGAITWTSSNSLVAEVTGCTGENSSDNRSADLTVTLTSKMEGTATITGTTANGLTASCEVTVTNDKKTVTVKDYTFYVTDTSGKPIYNASVSVGVDTVDTDAKGKAVFSSLKAKEDENGALSFDLDVSAMGYADFVEYDYAVGENHVTYITMLTISEADEDNGAMLQKNDCFESVLFKDAMFGNIDLMVNQKTISLSEPGNTFDLTVKAKEKVKDAIQRYSILSGGRRVAESKTGEFKDLKYSLFEADKKVYILLDVEPGAGKYERMPTQRQQINLLVKNPGESAKTPIGSLSFGESLQFTVPENTPFIGGATFDLAKLNLPLDLKLSTDGSFMISVNTDDAKLIDKNSVLFKDADKDKDKVKKELKEKEVVDDSLFGMYKSAVEKSAENLANGKDEESFQKKELKFSDSFRFSTKIGGYISGKLNDSVRKGTGYLYIQVKSSYSANADFVVISVPVTVGIEVGATGKASAKVQADFTDPTKSIGDSVSAEILFYLAPYVKVSAGPGCSEVNVKLNGGFTLPINYYMMGEKKGLESIVLEADAKVSGKLFCLEKEWEVVSGKFNVYTRADKEENAKTRS